MREQRGTLWMVAGASAALLFMFIRLIHVISFTEPLHVVTSGFEEESLYAMWKWLHGQAIYTDPHAIPFSASYFNWLYYAIYGSVIRGGTVFLGLGDEWIPTVGRAFTFLSVGIACFINTWLLSSPVIMQQPLSRLLAFSLSALLWCGPLIGFWAMTVRPDVIALGFDLIAASLFLRYYSPTTGRAILLAAIACYLSWACKQVNIVMPGAIGLFLLCQRRYFFAIAFGMLMIGGYGITLWLADTAMLNMLLFKGTAIPLSWEVWMQNMMNFAKKTFPAWCLFIGMIIIKMREKVSQSQKAIGQSAMAVLGGCGLFVWSLTLWPASSKVGSADNYYFIALLFLIFIIAPGLGNIRSLYKERLLMASGGLFCLMMMAAFRSPSLPLLAVQHEQNSALKACILEQRAPVFIMHQYVSLPWMNPHSPAFMLAYNYWFDRQVAIPFQEDGIGGLIRKQYFSTLLLPVTIENTFDGGDLTMYHKLPQPCAGYAIYIVPEGGERTQPTQHKFKVEKV